MDSPPAAPPTIRYPGKAAATSGRPFPGKDIPARAGSWLMVT